MNIPVFHLPIAKLMELNPIPKPITPKPFGTPNQNSTDILKILPPKLPAFEQLWGVYDKGLQAQIFDVDTCISIHPDSSAKVSNFPVEGGQFSSYNKVQTPLTCKINLAVAGAARIKQFLNDLESVSKDINLYTIVTPERVYTNMNLEKYSYPRSLRDGMNLVQADLTFVEIRIVYVAFTNAEINMKAPSKPKAKPPVDSGIQQTSPNVLIYQALKNTSLSKQEKDNLLNFGNTLHDTGTLSPQQLDVIKSYLPKAPALQMIPSH